MLFNCFNHLLSRQVRIGREALHLALRRMELNDAHRWYQQLATNPKSTRAAVIGAGIIGDPRTCPMANPNR